MPSAPWRPFSDATIFSIWSGHTGVLIYFVSTLLAMIKETCENKTKQKTTTTKKKKTAYTPLKFKKDPSKILLEESAWYQWSEIILFVTRSEHRSIINICW